MEIFYCRPLQQLSPNLETGFCLFLDKNGSEVGQIVYLKCRFALAVLGLRLATILCCRETLALRGERRVYAHLFDPWEKKYQGSRRETIPVLFGKCLQFVEGHHQMAAVSHSQSC